MIYLSKYLTLFLIFSACQKAENMKTTNESNDKKQNSLMYTNNENIEYQSFSIAESVLDTQNDVKIFVELDPNEQELTHNHTDKNLDGAINIGSFRQMFLDSQTILEERNNLVESIHQADKSGPLIVPDQPWEGSNNDVRGVWMGGSSVIYDKNEKLFKIWYAAQSKIDGKMKTYGCYATSKDGFKWEKPNLNKIEDYTGSKNNNIFGGGNMSVSIHYDAPKEKRYKGWAEAGANFSSFYSADGINWIKNTIYPRKLGDVGTMVYDYVKNEFLLTIKGSYIDENGHNTRKQYNILSKDLNTYPSSEVMSTLISAGDKTNYVDARSYGLSYFAYEGVYIGFHQLFQISESIPDSFENGVVSAQVLIKRNSFINQWYKPSLKAIIPRGDNGEWDDGIIAPASHPLIINNQIWLYYSGFDGPHITPKRTAKIGLARWRLDGFMSEDAGEEPGYFITKPLYFTGKHLFLNANIDQDGYIQVEILNRDNQVIGEFSNDHVMRLSGDNLAHLVKWKNSSNLSSLEGSVIKLKITMKKAQLFSFYFK